MRANEIEQLRQHIAPFLASLSSPNRRSERFIESNSHVIQSVLRNRGNLPDHDGSIGIRLLVKDPYS